MDTQEKTSQRKPRKAKAVQPQYDPNYAIALTEQPQFDPNNGSRLSKACKRTFNQTDWTQFLEFGLQQGWKIIEVVFLPKGWQEPAEDNFFKQ